MSARTRKLKRLEAPISPEDYAKALQGPDSVFLERMILPGIQATMKDQGPAGKVLLTILIKRLQEVIAHLCEEAAAPVRQPGDRLQLANGVGYDVAMTSVMTPANLLAQVQETLDDGGRRTVPELSDLIVEPYERVAEAVGTLLAQGRLGVAYYLLEDQ